MTDAHCDRTGSPPWLAMIRLHAGGPNRYYLCAERGAIREDVYRDNFIVEHHWYDAPDGMLTEAVREEALRAPLRGRLEGR